MDGFDRNLHRAEGDTGSPWWFSNNNNDCFLSDALDNNNNNNDSDGFNHAGLEGSSRSNGAHRSPGLNDNRRGFESSSRSNGFLTTNTYNNSDAFGVRVPPWLNDSHHAHSNGALGAYRSPGMSSLLSGGGGAAPSHSNNSNSNSDAFASSYDRRGLFSGGGTGPTTPNHNSNGNSNGALGAYRSPGVSSLLSGGGGAAPSHNNNSNSNAFDDTTLPRLDDARGPTTPSGFGMPSSSSNNNNNNNNNNSGNGNGALRDFSGRRLDSPMVPSGFPDFKSTPMVGFHGKSSDSAAAAHSFSASAPSFGSTAPCAPSTAPNLALTIHESTKQLLTSSRRARAPVLAPPPRAPVLAPPPRAPVLAPPPPAAAASRKREHKVSIGLDLDLPPAPVPKRHEDFLAATEGLDEKTNQEQIDLVHRVLGTVDYGSEPYSESIRSPAVKRRRTAAASKRIHTPDGSSTTHGLLPASKRACNNSIRTSNSATRSEIEPAILRTTVAAATTTTTTTNSSRSHTTSSSSSGGGGGATKQPPGKKADAEETGKFCADFKTKQAYDKMLSECFRNQMYCMSTDNPYDEKEEKYEYFRHPSISRYFGRQNVKTQEVTLWYKNRKGKGKKKDKGKVEWQECIHENMADSSALAFITQLHGGRLNLSLFSAPKAGDPMTNQRAFTALLIQRFKFQFQDDHKVEDFVKEFWKKDECKELVNRAKEAKKAAAAAKAASEVEEAPATPQQKPQTQTQQAIGTQAPATPQQQTQTQQSLGTPATPGPQNHFMTGAFSTGVTVNFNYSAPPAWPPPPTPGPPPPTPGR